jgi:hypothetical protein
MHKLFFHGYRNAIPVSFLRFPDVLRSVACANRFSTLLFRFLLIPKEIRNRVVKDHLVTK